MTTISTCLWFDNDAVEAVKFYCSLIPNSTLDRVQKSPADNPSAGKGKDLVVSFTLAGQPYLAINGGHRMEYTYAMSLYVECADQAEVDKIWNAFADGGEPIQCGWIKDRWGVMWQVAPKQMLDIFNDPD